MTPYDINFEKAESKWNYTDIIFQFAESWSNYIDIEFQSAESWWNHINEYSFVYFESLIPFVEPTKKV